MEKEPKKRIYTNCCSLITKHTCLRKQKKTDSSLLLLYLLQKVRIISWWWCRFVGKRQHWVCGGSSLLLLGKQYN